jgi:hypothetical protein
METWFRRAQGVAKDGRLHNVRLQHTHLRLLHDSLLARKEQILEALCKQFPNFASQKKQRRELAFLYVLYTFELYVTPLDQALETAKYKQWIYAKSTREHQVTQPDGLVAILAVDNSFSNPLANHLIPLAAAIAAGNAASIISSEGPFTTLLCDIFASCLDVAGYSVFSLPNQAIDTKAYNLTSKLADKLVTFEIEKATRLLSNVVNIELNGRYSIVIDQSIVDESVYRDPHSLKPNSHKLTRLNSVIDQVNQALDLAVAPDQEVQILVSETIIGLVREKVNFSGLSRVELVSTRSTEHVIHLVQKR